MSVWLCLPSARSVAEANSVFDQWRALGYKIAVARDDSQPVHADYTLSAVEMWGQYPGYAVACNQLIRDVAHIDQAADWFVCAGDDTLPDSDNQAEEIALECSIHFAETWALRRVSSRLTNHTFGVMQPTGDRWGDRNGAYIDRVAGSPWIGREFALRMYGGNGPYWPEYFHMGVDEELQAMAERLGVFWQCQDLTQRHQHWGRPRDGERIGQASRMPAFLERANSAAEWQKYKALFTARKEARFPGHEPIL